MAATIQRDEGLAQLFQRDQGLVNANNRAWVAAMGLTPGRMPGSPQEADIADKILADEMKRMSVTDIERATFDVHGIALNRKQDPDDIDKKLKDLETEIQAISPTHKQGYEKAKYLNEEFVSDRDFRLMFLRCDDYDVQVAAQRMVNISMSSGNYLETGPR